MRKPIKDVALNYLYGSYVRRAERCGYQFELSRDEFEELTCAKCQYCGNPHGNTYKKQLHKKTTEHREFKYNGIDRLDNSLGYIKSNVVSCCGKCNEAKMRLDSTEFLELIDRIRKHTNLEPYKIFSDKKLEYYIKRAQVIAENSPDIHTQVGAILVNKKSGAVIAEGYNGYVRGTCDHKIPKTRPEKYDYTIHAETNLICNSVRHGIATTDCILFCTLSPCTNCLRMCYQAGIDEIYFLEEYRDFNKSSNMLDLNVHVEQICTNEFKLSKITLTPKE